ncbi:Spore coat protein U (SCPU) domain-containing protein [Izhakiella capsodis]|uniref:Spore coat protein U (SCPU) domain-containing protein n=1 Tax=Izhakiella capsodis TaxID=1367852 RepID=A0A1I4VXU5_9GAMM|nr:spore coat U domain-containing protein [Izhakiella capsodis]SFN06114.1 Spore coat protein U (SCPU) domain-containing protein [Izhakiella capsodis]
MINNTIRHGLLILLLLCAKTALGSCSLPAKSAAFGTVTTFNINSTLNTTASAIQVDCGAGLTLGLLSSDAISLRLLSATFSNGSRGVMQTGASGSDSIPVQLCLTPNCGNELTINPASTITLRSTDLLSLILSGKNFIIPVYLRTVPGAVVSAGNYQVRLSVQVSYNICTSIGLLNICLTPQIDTTVVPVTVTMNITNDCTTISAPDINFGSAPLVDRFASISQSLSVVCSKGSTYSIGLSNGRHANNNQRYMANGTNLLAYEIYKGSSSNRWGPTGTERVASSTASSTSTDGQIKTYNYTAAILSAQATPAIGSYSDSVIVDLSF